MIATGVMSAVHNTFAKAVFSTEHWRQAGASQGNGGNAIVLAGMSQWSSPFADMLAYSINTEGQGALPEMDGMNAFGFPWCPAGRAPDVELVENEFPLFIPISSHWKDSAGHGKYRGGVGTAQLWVAHHVPMVFMMAIADNSKIQTPQGLFGGYAPCTIPGVSVASADLMQRLEAGDAIDLDITEVLRSRSIGGEWGNEFQGRAPRPYMENDVITVAFATGGAGTATRWSATRSRSATTSTRGWSPNGPRSTSTRSSGIRSAGGSTPPRRTASRRRTPGAHRSRTALRGIRGGVAAAQAARGNPHLVRHLARRQGGRAADAALTRRVTLVPAPSARSRAKLLARRGRVSPALVCPLVLVQAAEIEALSEERFLTDATKLANGLRALHTSFGHDVIVTAAADGLAARGRGARPVTARGPPPLRADPRVAAAVEATRRLAVTADDAALAVALCGPARLAAELGQSPVDQAALETCGAVLLTLAKAFLEAGANLLLLVEAEPLPAASAGAWRSAATPLVNVARFHQAAAAVVLADSADAALAPRGAVVCLPPQQAGPVRASR